MNDINIKYIIIIILYIYIIFILFCLSQAIECCLLKWMYFENNICIINVLDILFSK